jgi:hypothetical protein
MVAFLAYFTVGRNSKQYILQISVFPTPSCVIHLADAATIKVSLFIPAGLDVFLPCFIGSFNLSFQVSEARISI